YPRVPQTMPARNLLRLTLVARRSVSTASASQLGFIGLGNMGASMATNLAKAGHQVRVFDVSRAAIDAVVAGSEGRASVASSANEVVPGASAVVTMLPSSKEVTQIYSGSMASWLPAKAMAPCLLTAPLASRACARRLPKRRNRLARCTSTPQSAVALWQQKMPS
ncbi:hypothetical protein BOX15_Mlig008395g2, partial [Macrostomum lignano]